MNTAEKIRASWEDAQEGWFWTAKRGYSPKLHLPGPTEGWSLCGAARLGNPANHRWRHGRVEIGGRCEACKRLS